MAGEWCIVGARYLDVSGHCPLHSSASPLLVLRLKGIENVIKGPCLCA
jgi:hypothetical protein